MMKYWVESDRAMLGEIGPLQKLEISVDSERVSLMRKKGALPSSGF